MVLLLVIIYLAFISLGLPDSLFGVSWPVIHFEFGLELGFASIVTIIVALGTVWTSLFAGKVIRKFGTGKVTAVSVGLTAIALFGISFSTSIWMMIGFSIVLGIGAGAVDSGLNDYVARFYKPQHMNWLHCFWGIGVTTSPLVMSWFLSGGNSWRGGYQTIGFIQLGLVIVLFAALPLWNQMEKKHQLDRLNKKQNSSQYKTEEVTDTKIRPFKIKGVPYAMAILAFYCALEYTMGTWGASFLIQTRGIDPATAAQWVSFYYGGIMTGRFIAGFVSMKVSDKTMIRFGMAIVVLGVFFLMLPWGNGFTFVGLIMVGLGCAPIFPSSIHATPDRFGEKFSPDIVGYQMAGAYVGALLLAPLAGWISSQTTFLVMPFFLMGFVIIQIIFSGFLEKKIECNPKVC